MTLWPSGLRPGGLGLALGLSLLLAGCPPGGATSNKSTTETPAAPSPGESADSGGAPRMGSARAGPRPLPEVLAFTAETRGYLEPCGCTDRMLGGLARRASLFARLRRLGRRPLPFETGDLLQEPGRQTELKLEALAASFRAMGVRAVGLGERDLMLGLDRLEALARAGGFSFIATNLVPKAEGAKRPGWLQTAVRVTSQAGPVRIEAVLSPAFAGDVEALTDGRFTLAAPVRQAERRADAPPVVVLYHGPADEAARLLRDRADVLLVAAGHDRLRPGSAAALANGAPVLALSDRGKDVTLVDLLPPLPDATGPRFGAPDAVALADQIPDDGAVAAIYARYRARLYGENLVAQAEQRPPATGGRFTGPEACITCHPKEGAVFRSMAHHHAYESLVARKAERDPECIRCHTTGFGYEGGFSGKDRTPALAQVSCETCHGVGSNHAAAPQPGYGRIPKPEALCRTCHDALNSPRFDFNAYWKRISHGR